MPRSAVTRRAEEALIVSFVSDRKLFGLAYWEVQPDYFDQMPKESGVFIAPLVLTKDIVGHAMRPGDIDVLIIPYEGDELVLDRVLVLEAKAVRARFTKQQKSPNDFGFSQAAALLELGFPFVALAHLIVSDTSPEEHWREMMIAEVLDQEGNVRPIGNERIDVMPHNLVDRTFGRLTKTCSTSGIGLISAYICSPLLGSASRKQHTIVFPVGRPAFLNPQSSVQTLNRVADYYYENFNRFLDNPRFDR